MKTCVRVLSHWVYRIVLPLASVPIMTQIIVVSPWEKAFRSYSVPIPCVTQTCAVQFLFCRTMGRGHSDAEDSTNQATVECRNPKGAVLYQVQENFPHISLFSVFRQHKHNHVSTQSTIFFYPASSFIGGTPSTDHTAMTHTDHSSSKSPTSTAQATFGLDYGRIPMSGDETYREILESCRHFYAFEHPSPTVTPPKLLPLLEDSLMLMEQQQQQNAKVSWHLFC